MNRVFRVLGQYLIGLALALAGIWLITSIFLDDVTAYAWDPALSQSVEVPGSKVQWRSEGWGTTQFGSHGFVGCPDEQMSDAPKVVIWGNSYVQGLQVDDRLKMSSLLKEDWNARHENKVDVLNIGKAGKAVTDCYFQYPKYSPLIKNAKVHVVVIGGMEELLPGTTNRQNLFLDTPAFSLVEVAETPSHEDLNRRLWASLKMQFVWNLGRQAVSAADPGQWRLGVGPVHKPKSDTKAKGTVDAPGAIRYVLGKFKETWKEPIVFVYLPTVPRIAGGQVVTSDEDQNLADLLAGECAGRGYTLISMKQPFLDYFRAEGKFPRGFANSRLAAGHLNPGGHKLVADAVCRELEMNYDAVLSEGISPLHSRRAALSDGGKKP